MKYNKILVIDNDWDDIDIFRKAVLAVSPAIRCTFKSDAQLALDYLREKRLVPKAIFLDIEMEKLNGHEFLKLVKEDETISHIPVFILSNHSADTIKSQTIAAGAAGFITKPSTFPELVSILRDVLL
ncbi:response regulator [Flavobacterium magnum]|uniref:Response regulator n=1 Tax=Flavobacterium magnum TaxID=2162713 RepID=A0A2S0RI23_9FLAO|nr:response regulator [Flavobacterium magnum]AWA30910.1 response regulator [Flavobacterium magnum]